MLFYYSGGLYRSGREQDGGIGIGVEKSIWESRAKRLNLEALHAVPGNLNEQLKEKVHVSWFSLFLGSSGFSDIQNHFN